MTRCWSDVRTVRLQRPCTRGFQHDAMTVERLSGANGERASSLDAHSSSKRACGAGRSEF